MVGYSRANTISLSLLRKFISLMALTPVFVGLSFTGGPEVGDDQGSFVWGAVSKAQAPPSSGPVSVQNGLRTFIGEASATCTVTTPMAGPQTVTVSATLTKMPVNGTVVEAPASTSVYCYTIENGVQYKGVTSNGTGFFYTWTNKNKNTRTDNVTWQETISGQSGPPFSFSVSASVMLVPSKKCDPCESAAAAAGQVANPINAVSGSKTQSDTDFIGGESTGLSLTRVYDSLIPSNNEFGRNWTSNWRRRITSSDNGAGLKYAASVQREDGREDKFQYNSSTNTYFSTPDVRAQLYAVPTAGATQIGWKLIRDDDSVEYYTMNGLLRTITTRSRRVTTLGYDASNRLTSVTGPFGHKLIFDYGANNRVSQMTTPDNGVYKYAYDAAGNLISVTYPDNTVLTYVYENATFPNALTGVFDELGNRYATYGYNASGLATSSEHAGGVDKTVLIYNPNGSTTVTDPRGNIRTYAATAQFGLDKLTSIAGAPLQTSGGMAFGYDANGFISSRTDWNNNVTTYVRDARGNETSRTEAAGTALERTITTMWHPVFHLPTRVTEPGRLTAYAYDAKGNLLTKTLVSGTLTRKFSYTYNASGQVLTATDPLGHVTSYAYDAKGNLARMTNALGHVTSFTNYDGAGRLLRAVDPNGVATTFTYDLRGRVTSRTVGAIKTSYSYDKAGNLIRVTQPDGSRLTYGYDQAHRLVGIADKLANRIIYTLDVAGNRIRERVFDPTNVLTRTRSFAYDSVNRLNKAIGAVGETTTYNHDGEGNLTSVVDPLAHTTSYAYDALNRLAQAADPNGGTTALVHDPLDHLTSLTDPRGLKTSYTWNGLDDQKAVLSPDASGTSRSFDDAGNVLTSTDARGKTTSYAYGALNRRTSASFADGTSIAYQYDQGTNGVGRLTKITDATGSTSYSYDANGHVIQKTQVIGALTRVTKYAYDAGGRLSSVTYPSGFGILYAYDAAGRVTGLKRGNGQIIVDGVTYSPFGGAIGWTFGNGAAYGRTIDLNGRIAGLALPANDNLALTYDAAGRIAKITDSAIDAKTFGYDALDRLTSYAGGALTQAYGYDADGNRTSASLTNGAVTNAFAYAFAASNNRLGSISGAWSETFSYDAVGNAAVHNTPSANYAFGYDARGRMVISKLGALAKTYGINGLGQRVVKANPVNTNDKTHFVYDEAGHLIGEYGATGGLIQETVWLGDLPVATLRPTGNFYIAPDHLGAPHQITNAAQQVVWLWDHDPFGNGAPTGVAGFAYNLRFPGQYFDAETGLHYNYFRDYDPKLGRYVQSDPIGLKGGINTYAYVKGNPLNYTDPEGKNADAAIGAAQSAGPAVAQHIAEHGGVNLGAAGVKMSTGLWGSVSRGCGVAVDLLRGLLDPGVWMGVREIKNNAQDPYAVGPWGNENARRQMQEIMAQP